MRSLNRVAFLCLIGIVNACAFAQSRPIDFLDYFLQSDDKSDEWTINGTDIRADRDPDGTAARTVILNKWSSPTCFEVFKITDEDIQLRYEVVRSVTENWVRRYEEIDLSGSAPGAIWTKRKMIPNGKGFLSRFRQDRFIYDKASQSYVIDRAGSNADMATYLSVFWADDTFPAGNRSGFEISKVLRLISQWQRDGLIFEMYHYARGKGPVAWRWLERVSTLRPAENDRSGKIFHCENGYVLVMGKGDEDHEPEIYHYNIDSRQKTRRLETIRFTSYWKPELGEVWYVIYRDTTRETALTKKIERVAHDFSLPGWKDKPDATLKDLPHLFIHAPK